MGLNAPALHQVCTRRSSSSAGGQVPHSFSAGTDGFAELRDAIPTQRFACCRSACASSNGKASSIDKVIPETPVRVEYELTAKGHALEQPLAAVGKWAERWAILPAAAKAGRRNRGEAVRGRR